MKKVLGAAIVAALLAGTHNAHAIPTLKLSLSQGAATAAQCSGLGGSFGSGECSFSTTAGLISVMGGYGSFSLNQELAMGYPLQAQPALWLNSTNQTSTAGSITVKLVAQNYNSPFGAFPLLSTASGSVDAGMSVSLNSFFDVDNTGAAGAGIQLLDADWVGFASGAVPKNQTTAVNSGDGLYSVSWILTVTRATTGALTSAGINGTLSKGVPAPAAAALLGLGLLAIGFVRRRTV